MAGILFIFFGFQNGSYDVWVAVGSSWPKPFSGLALANFMFPDLDDLFLSIPTALHQQLSSFRGHRFQSNR